MLQDLSVCQEDRESRDQRTPSGGGYGTPFVDAPGIAVSCKYQVNVANEPLLCGDEFFPDRFIWCSCLMSRVRTQNLSLSVVSWTVPLSRMLPLPWFTFIIRAEPSPTHELEPGPAAKTFKSNHAVVDGASRTVHARGAQPDDDDLPLAPVRPNEESAPEVAVRFT